MILTKITHCFPDILYIGLLSFYYIVSTSLQVVGALVEATGCWVVLSSNQDLGRYARVQLSLIFLNLVSLWRLLLALVVLLTWLVGNLLLANRSSVLRIAVVAATQESIPFDRLVIKLLSHIHVCSLALRIGLILSLVLLGYCN